MIHKKLRKTIKRAGKTIKDNKKLIIGAGLVVGGAALAPSIISAAKSAGFASKIKSFGKSLFSQKLSGTPRGGGGDTAPIVVAGSAAPASCAASGDLFTLPEYLATLIVLYAAARGGVWVWRLVRG